MPERMHAEDSAGAGTTAAWEGDRTRGAVGSEAPVGVPSLADLEITAQDLRTAQGRLESLLRLHRA